MGSYRIPEDFNPANGEFILFKLRRSLRSMLFEIVLIAGTISLIITAAENGYLGSSSLRAAALLPALMLLSLLRRYYNDHYTFTNKDITQHKGVLSLAYASYSIEYLHIRNAMVTQSLLGRILNYGNLVLDTAATDNVEIQIRGIAAPGKLLRQIEKISRKLKQYKNNDDAS